MKPHRFLFQFGLCASTLVAATASNADVSYKLTDLPPPPGNYQNWTQAQSINNSGQVIGYVYGAGNHTEGAVWAGGNVQVLPSSSSYYGYPFNAPSAINNGGVVVGTSYNEAGSANGGPSAYVWVNGSGAALPRITNGAISYARGINDANQIVGESQTNSGYGAAFPVTWVGGQISLLAVPQGVTGGSTNAINASGTIAGSVYTVDASNTIVSGSALVWANSGSIPQALPSNAAVSFATAINNSGEVAGMAGNHAALWREGSFIDLGTLAGYSISEALAINDSGVVVGRSEGILPGTAGSQTTAFIWDSTHGMRNLNSLIDPSLGWALLYAQGINNNGTIVGLGENAAGALHAFELTPVPEPATYTLMAVGLGLIQLGARASMPLAGRTLGAWRPRRRGASAPDATAKLRLEIGSPR